MILLVRMRNATFTWTEEDEGIRRQQYESNGYIEMKNEMDEKQGDHDLKEAGFTIEIASKEFKLDRLTFELKRWKLHGMVESGKS